MEKKALLAVMLILVVGVLFLSGCTSSSGSYDYSGASGNGAAPVGGGCGVQMPSNDLSSAQQAGSAGQSSF
jgi:hypothetical protein